MSARSFRGWKRFHAVVSDLFSRVTLCLAQSRHDDERYAALGVPKVVVTGNLKFDSPPLGAAPDAVAAFRAAVGTRPVWVAASTHPGEEEIVAGVHRRLAERHPGLLTVIVPRHPERGPEIAARLAAEGLRVARRKADEPPTPDVAIYVADTLGELGLFYRVAPVAFVGGSLVAHGGQNPIEPVMLGCAVLHGPHVQNFADVYAALAALPDAAPPAVDLDGLGAALDAMLADPALRARRVEAARAALTPFTGALAATWGALAPFLVEPAARPAMTAVPAP